MTTYTFTNQELAFASNYVNGLNAADDAVRGTAKAIMAKLGKTRSLTDAKWQDLFSPFRNEAQLASGASLDDADDGAVRTYKSRVKGVLQGKADGYGVEIAAPAKSQTAEAKKRAENREKEQARLKPIAEKVARHAEANGISLTVAAAELADKKKDSKEAAEVIKAGKQAEKAQRDEREASIKQSRGVIAEFMKQATIKEASEAEAEVLHHMAALVMAHNASLATLRALEAETEEVEA